VSSFTDRTGQKWKVEFLFSHLGVLRSVLNCPQSQKLTPEVAINGLLTLDPEGLGQLLWSIVEDQAAGVTPEDFAKRLDANVVDEAFRCLLEEITCFFPRAGRESIRKNLPAILQKYATDMNQAYNQKFSQILNSSGGSGPAS
jgi:hypothetical protein